MDKLLEISKIVSKRHGDDDSYLSPIDYERDSPAEITIKMIFDILDAPNVPKLVCRWRREFPEISSGQYALPYETSCGKLIYSNNNVGGFCAGCGLEVEVVE